MHLCDWPHTGLFSSKRDHQKRTASANPEVSKHYDETDRPRTHTRLYTRDFTETTRMQGLPLALHVVELEYFELLASFSRRPPEKSRYPEKRAAPHASNDNATSILLELNDSSERAWRRRVDTRCVQKTRSASPAKHTTVKSNATVTFRPINTESALRYNSKLAYSTHCRYFCFNKSVTKPIRNGLKM